MAQLGFNQNYGRHILKPSQLCLPGFTSLQTQPSCYCMLLWNTKQLIGWQMDCILAWMYKNAKPCICIDSLTYSVAKYIMIQTLDVKLCSFAASLIMHWTGYFHKGMTRLVIAQTKLSWSIPRANLTHIQFLSPSGVTLHFLFGWDS